MKKKTKIILLVIHGFLLFVPFVVAAMQLKFPILDFERHSVHDLSIENFYPIFVGVWFLSVLAVVLLSEKIKILKWFTTYITVSGLIVFTVSFGAMCAWLEWGPQLYPLASKTEDVGNYLVLDTAVDYEFVSNVIPEQIPESAQNITYKYFYEPNVGNYTVSVSWNLSDVEYESELARFSSWDDGRKENSKSMTTGKNLYAMNATIEFEDSKNEIKYFIDVHYAK